MDNATVESSSKCGLCDGRGYYSVPDGDSDFQTVLCSCPAGQRLEEEAEAEAHEQRGSDFTDFMLPQFDAIHQVQRNLYRHGLI